MIKYIRADIQAETERQAELLTHFINETWCPGYATRDGVNVMLKGPIPEAMLRQMVGLAESLAKAEGQDV